MPTWAGAARAAPPSCRCRPQPTNALAAAHRARHRCLALPCTLSSSLTGTLPPWASKEMLHAAAALQPAAWRRSQTPLSMRAACSFRQRSGGLLVAAAGTPSPPREPSPPLADKLAAAYKARRLQLMPCPGWRYAGCGLHYQISSCSLPLRRRLSSLRSPAACRCLASRR